MMKRKESIQEALERIQAGKHQNSTVKKRRLSRIILVIDALVIVLILLFIYNRAPEKFYTSTSINHGGLQYRFSMTKEGAAKQYLFSLSIKNTLPQRKRVSYDEAISDLLILHGRDEVYRTAIGDAITRLSILPGEVKNFISVIDNAAIERFVSAHPEYIISEKGFLARRNEYVPLVALIRINIRESISTTLNFNHEVR
jgi:hypothetical protein